MKRSAVHIVTIKNNVERMVDMRGRGWTKEELELIRQGTPTRDVMEITGRSYSAVVTKRSILLHEYSTINEGVRIPPGLSMSQREKEDRIQKLANRLNIKLYRGMHRGKEVYGTE